MTASFVNSLRTSGAPLRVGEPGAAALRFRVEMPEVWDTIRIEAAESEPVASIKAAALERLSPGAPGAGPHEEYVMKLDGFEILDESASLAHVGVVDGSTFLLTSRRRRPVR
jgi:hypothetical protein